MPISTRSMSLVERKKLQWAKEREEMASLGAPWGPTDQPCERNRQEPKAPAVPYDYIRRNKDTRRGSLPPLYKNQFNSYDKEKDIGGETSGYGSDNPNQSPECIQNWHQAGYESSSSRDDRPKWGDKGVGVGKFWQPKEETAIVNEPPNWVKRGLQDGEIVVNNTSPAESPEQRFEENERPYTGSSYSHHRNTYIRGQNIPIDSVELAERERRRQVAMSHQEAIRQQLEDRERRRREEYERRIKEEHEEELRIEREQEMERQRKEKELKAMQEKQERDRKREEAIQEAIELAQKEAKLEKSKRINRQNNLKNTNIENEKRASSASETELVTKSDKEDNQVEEKRSNCDQLNNTRSIPSKNDLLNEVNNNNLEIRGKGINSPRPNNEVDNTAQVDNLTYQNTLNNNLLPTPRTQNLALVFQTPQDNLQNLQYALLVPATPQALPIAVPISFPTSDRSSNTARTENRLLTPTQYRNRNRKLCDSSTQTDDICFDMLDSCSSKEKPSNLELAYENRNRKERRSRSESLEERPKWGANRPPTRYVKQSEKDPLYQRRKLREKFRDRNSSDESQTGSPIFRKKEKRSTWRKNNQMFTRNVKMYHTEIIPLEADKDQLYYRNEGCCVCRCGKHRCPDDTIKVDILKIEHNSPRDNVQYKTEMIETSEKLPHLNNDILDKLSSLHNGLLMKQESWDNNSPSSLSSATRQRRENTHSVDIQISMEIPQMAKLDDFLVAKKKETAPILDLSKSSVNSKEEFRRLLEKVPDFKIKAERVAPESIKIREKNFKFKSGKKDVKAMKEKYSFMDPLPLEMKNLKINDLAAVSIDWKMLTTQRPKMKVEENYFSRLVELGKLQNKSRTQEKRQFQLDPQIRKVKNKSGIVEMRIVSCVECGEDFCNGKMCTKFGYDSFVRIPEVPKASQKISSPELGGKSKRKVKRRSKSSRKSKKKTETTSKSPVKRAVSKPKTNKK